MRNITPDKITLLQSYDIFVFGSDLQGYHNTGNAKLACDLFGAIIGKNAGPQGQSYAIPMFHQEIDSIKPFIESFFFYAKANKGNRFLVSSIGEEFGFSPNQIAPLFIEASNCDNVFLPKSYWRIIDAILRKKKYSQGGTDFKDDSSNTTILLHSLSSSYQSQYNIYLKLIQNVFYIGAGSALGITGFHIVITDSSTKKNFPYYIAENPSRIDISLFPNGIYSITVYCKTKTELYFEWYNIQFRKGNSDTYFCQSRNYVNNKNFVERLPKDASFLKSKLRLTATVPGALPKFINLAKRLTRYCQSDYDKILAIHDWIAKNISYDYDSLEDGSYKDIPLERSAIDTLLSRKGVCQGYTDLSIALLRAVNIPSAAIICLAQKDQHEFDSNIDSNHIFTASFVDKQWHLFDITWDSDMEYRNSTVRERTGNGISHQYYDCSLYLMSYTHRFDKIV